ncbi:transmembrane protein 35A [Drosophila guanche]|uniref:Novel acetylcholine receptor chaperone n=1 Tax=Drosophila guanche TaxID=7266 RepID=A0A3B0JUD0_DROGU|nr:transmembrane protein 35A [Drosophila guanche]SPP76966.1 blast:Transmembrane protein 35 [Drosophila guanche]
MPTSNTIVLKSLSVLLGLFFIFVGTLKLTPAISKDLYKDLRTEYVKYAKVFPLTALFGVKIPSKWYRRTIGILEIVCGLAMALIPYHKVKNVANVTLLVLMLLGIYQHWMVSDPFERSGPALVFTFMLGGRLVVWYQTARLQGEMTAATQAPANGVKQD